MQAAECMLILSATAFGRSRRPKICESRLGYARSDRIDVGKAGIWRWRSNFRVGGRRKGFANSLEPLGSGGVLGYSRHLWYLGYFGVSGGISGISAIQMARLAVSGRLSRMAATICRTQIGDRLRPVSYVVPTKCDS